MFQMKKTVSVSSLNVSKILLCLEYQLHRKRMNKIACGEKTTVYSCYNVTFINKQCVLLLVHQVSVYSFHLLLN